MGCRRSLTLRSTSRMISALRSRSVHNGRRPRLYPNRGFSERFLPKMLPKIDLPDLLFEVDSWTGFLALRSGSCDQPQSSPA